jgi:hypothetical protein
MRLIDAYSRGYISQSQYEAYIAAGVTNSTIIEVDTTIYNNGPWSMGLRLIKRDPNLDAELKFVLSDYSGAIGAGTQSFDKSPISGKILEWTILADQSGSIVLDIWKKSTFPPIVSDTITASAKPTISSAQYATSSTLTGWTTDISAGDYFIVNVDSCSTISTATLILKIEPSAQVYTYYS